MLTEQQKGWLLESGIPVEDWVYVNFIFHKESGWCPTKWNGQIGYCPEAPTARPITSSGAYGIGQALPAEKMSAYGSDYMSNPITQLRWAQAYVKRYGTWEAAFNFWVANHWW